MVSSEKGSEYEFYCFFISLCLLLFNIVFGIYGIIKSLKSKFMKTRSDKLYIVISVAFICSGILSCALNELIGLSTSSQFHGLVINAVYIASLICYMIGLLLMYLLYLLRLNNAFIGTPFVDSTWIFPLCLSLCIIQAISICFMASLITLPLYLLNEKNLAFYGYAIFFIINILSNILFLYIWGRKMYMLGPSIMSDNMGQILEMSVAIKCDTVELVEERTESKSSQTQQSKVTKSGDSNNDGSLLTVSMTDSKEKEKKSKIISKKRKKKRKKENKLLTQTIRNMVCALIAMITSNLLSILGFYTMLKNDNKTLLLLYLLLIILDHSINMICLYLQYISRNKYYAFCSKLHGYIYSLVAPNIAGNVLENEPIAGNYDPQKEYTSTGNVETRTESRTPVDVPKLRRDKVSDLEMSSKTFS